VESGTNGHTPSQYSGRTWLAEDPFKVIAHIICRILTERKFSKYATG